MSGFACIPQLRISLVVACTALLQPHTSRPSRTAAAALHCALPLLPSRADVLLVFLVSDQRVQRNQRSPWWM